MQADTRNDAHARSSERSGRRIRDAVLDFLSPTLHCEACGADVKQRRCERTGGIRTVPVGEGWRRWASVEIEYRCPACSASIWVLDVPAQYPIF